MPIDDSLDPKNDPSQTIEDLGIRASAFNDAITSIISDMNAANSGLNQRFDISLQNIRKVGREVFNIYDKTIGAVGKGNKGLLERKKVNEQILKNIQAQNQFQGLIKILEAEALVVGGERAKQLLNVTAYLSEQEQTLGNINLLWQKERDAIDELNRKKLQPLVGILKGISKIPIIGDVINVQRGVDLMETAQKPIEAGGKGIQNYFKLFSIGLKETFRGFGGILGKLALITAPFMLIIKLIKLWVGGMLDADKMNTNIARNLGVQKTLAQDIRKIYVHNKANVNDIFFTTTNQVEAAEELNNAFGTGYIFSKEILKNQIDLSKVMGLSVEESIALNKIFGTQEMTSEEFLESITKQTLEVNKQKKIQLNYKQIYQDISKLSGIVLSNYKNQVPQLANAVAQVKALGLSMDDASQISSHLLDWQSSIESELEAELLMGRGLNAERARGLALMGKTDKAAKALMEDAGLTFDSFSDLNVIVKGSLAKYMGLNADKLADALLIQKNMTAATEVQRKEIEKAIPTLEKRNNFYKEMNDPKNITRGLMELTIQQKFNQALLKAKEIFSDFVSGGMLNNLVDVLTNLINKLQRYFRGADYKHIGKQTFSEIQSNTNISNSQKEFANEIQKTLTKTRSGFYNALTPAVQVSYRKNTNEIKNQILDRINQGEKFGSLDEIYKVMFRSLARKEGSTLSDDEIDKIFNSSTFHNKIIKGFKRGKVYGTPVMSNNDKIQEDFVMKGNKIVPFRKDDIIMGGTSLLGGDNNQVVKLLREIASAIKDGKGVYLNGQKVGMAMAMNSTNIP